MPDANNQNQERMPDEVSALIEKIPAVQACRIIEENGLPREIHILADDSRAPKQIARDIQSALMARFGLYVDHRLISIAQIPCAFTTEDAPAPTVPVRLICSRLALALDKREIEAKVTLTLGERVGEAVERGRLSTPERQRVIARATVEAITQFLPEGSVLRLNDMGESVLDGRRVILAAVALETPEATDYLVGAAFGREDADVTVVHAVLDAINRRLRL